MIYECTVFCAVPICSPATPLPPSTPTVATPILRAATGSLRLAAAATHYCNLQLRAASAPTAAPGATIPEPKSSKLPRGAAAGHHRHHAHSHSSAYGGEQPSVRGFIRWERHHRPAHWPSLLLRQHSAILAHISSPARRRTPQQQ